MPHTITQLLSRAAYRFLSKLLGVLIGFATEDEWFDYRLEHDARFLERIERARQSLRSGRGVEIEDVEA